MSATAPVPPAAGGRYTVLAAPVEHELEIKRSRFICRLHRVEDETAARAAVTAAREEHRLARHHCSAFVLGPERRVQRSSDDGEPAGTAGTPMLEALVLRDTGVPQAPLSDVVAVVIRYFGGVLLGAGGLVRAYSEAVSSTLDVGRLLLRERRRILELTAGHAEAGRWENELRAAGCILLPSEYGDGGVRLRLAVADEPSALTALDERVAGVTQGRARLRTLDTAWVDLS